MAFADPMRIHAHREDYRAGQAADFINDKAGKMITCPMLALWDAGGIPNKTSGPLVIWREWSPRAQGQPIKSGHFLAEENPAATVTALIDFFAAT